MQIPGEVFIFVAFILPVILLVLNIILRKKGWWILVLLILAFGVIGGYQIFRTSHSDNGVPFLMGSALYLICFLITLFVWPKQVENREEDNEKI